MSQTEDAVKESIMNYVAKRGGAYGYWYVGVTRDVKKDLFKKHNVDKNKVPWFYKDAFDYSEACRIYEYMLKAGFDGDKIPKDIKAKTVYVYRKSRDTRE